MGFANDSVMVSLDHGDAAYEVGTYLDVHTYDTYRCIAVHGGWVDDRWVCQWVGGVGGWVGWYVAGCFRASVWVVALLSAW